MVNRWIGFVLVMALGINASTAQEPDKADVGHEYDAVISQPLRHKDLVDSALPSGQCATCHRAGSEVAQVTRWLDNGDSELYYFTEDLNDSQPYMAWLNLASGNSTAQLSRRLGQVECVVLTDPLFRSHLPIGKEAALLVTASDEESTDQAGLKRGDVVLAVAGTSVADVARVQEVVDSKHPGNLRVTLIRAGKKAEVEVVSKELVSPDKPYRIGVQVEEVGEALRTQLRLYENEGLLITEVMEGSPAEVAEMKKHDVLLRAGEHRISNLEDLRVAVSASEGESLEFTLMRGGKEIKLAATPEQEPSVDVTYRVQFCPAAKGLRYTPHQQRVKIDASRYVEPAAESEPDGSDE